MATTKQTVSTNDLSIFGARLRKSRNDQGLSRAALSRLTENEISARVIDHLEQGTTDATIRRAEVLAGALDIEMNWLLFGEPGDELDNDTEDPEDTPVDLPGVPEIPGKTGQDRSEIPGEPGQEQSRPVGPVRTDPARKYFDKLEDILIDIDELREQGLQNHPRKMPKLIQRASDTGEFLELSDIQELAFERDIKIPETDITELGEEKREELMDELVRRLIDSAVLGIDLYKLDMDTLDIFRKKHTEVSAPAFRNWRGHTELVPEIRESYRSKAMEGNISITTSLAQISE